MHINALILVHIHYEYFAHGIQAPQEGGLFSIAPIGTHPSELHAQFALVVDHLQGQFHLAATTLLLRRYARFATAPRVVHPRFGQIQAQIRQGRQMALAQGTKNTHLAVVHFALSSVPLARYAHGVFAFLGKARFIDHKATVRRSTQPTIGLLGYLIEHCPVVPIRIREHVLEALLVGLHHRLFHALHVLALRLHQPFEVIACGLKDRAGFALKMLAVTSMKSQKAIGNFIN